jgi:predicted nuclease with TOPRIM domain
VDNFVNALASSNAEVDNLQEELMKKTDENSKQNDELLRLAYEVRRLSSSTRYDQLNLDARNSSSID